MSSARAPVVLLALLFLACASTRETGRSPDGTQAIDGAGRSLGGKTTATFEENASASAASQPSAPGSRDEALLESEAAGIGGSGHPEPQPETKAPGLAVAHPVTGRSVTGVGGADSGSDSVAADLAAAADAARSRTETGSIDTTRVRYVAYCASCHGETGDGRGRTVLDPPVRSFRDGGFVHGGTTEALVRTISTGIRGTAMPGFASALSPDDLRALAEYVATLGPPRASEPVDVVHVVDRPRIVEGMLPALDAHGDAATRGVLIGLVDGSSFEYEASDVRPRAIRIGGFVRTRERAGAEHALLEPLGRLVCVLPRPLGTLEVTDEGLLPRGRPLVRELASTWVRGGNAGLSYRLVDAERGRLADVEEECTASIDGEWVTWTRLLRVENVPTAWRLRIHAGFGPGVEVRWQTDRLPEEEYGGAARHAVLEVAEDRAAEMTVLTSATCASFVQDAIDFEIPARWVSAFEISFRIRVAGAVEAPAGASSPGR